MPNDRRTPSRTTGGRRGSVGNEDRLMALGDAVDRRSGVERRPARKRGGNSFLRTRTAKILVAAAIGLVAVAGGSYLYGKWRFSHIATGKCGAACLPTISGQPFNVLSVGSDSRAGLTGAMAAQTGASTGSAAGQRSDVVKIFHIDPGAGTISVVSIPRDTMVTLLANQNLYGNFNRINVNYGNGPSLLARTITANFGIPINHVVQVSFGGLANTVAALGGVYLSFPYPAHDVYSGLQITHAGCQLLNGTQALAVARSRHFYYNVAGNGRWPGDNSAESTKYALGWRYDGSSDYGRIHRQDAFLRAMITAARGQYNPFTINDVLSKLPEGITLDTGFSFNDVVGLAVKFHAFDPSKMVTYTLPTYSPPHLMNGMSVLLVNQPAAQQLLVSIFGSELLRPTNPPPNENLQTPQPPYVPVTSTTTTVATHHHTGSTVPTPTTVPVPTAPGFDPVPCAPTK